MTNAKLIADYKAGLNTKDLAARYGVTEWTVRHRLHRAAVTLRPMTISEEQIAWVTELRAEGLSYDRIAERIGFSASTVRNVLQRPKA